MFDTIWGMKITVAAAEAHALRATARLGQSTWQVGGERGIPLLEPLQRLEPWGIRRGTTIGVKPSAVSLAYALAAGVSRDGEWVALVGCEHLGHEALAGLGVELRRCICVPRPAKHWATALAALLEVCSLVVAAEPSARVDTRRVRALARERRCVVVAAGDWLPAPDVSWDITAATWEGIGAGYGALRSRRVTVQATGRGRHQLLREVELYLPDATGGLAAVELPPVAEQAEELVQTDSGLAGLTALTALPDASIERVAG